MIDNISQATLDVIEAIKENKTIGFKYGQETKTIREVKPVDFYGDFDGFGGTDINLDKKTGNYRRFSFNKINEWIGDISMQNNKTIDSLEIALSQSQGITKDAKYLCYPIGDIKVKLSGLAEEHGLEDEMEVYLDAISYIANDLESAFYSCESVFRDKIRELELEVELEEEGELCG